MARAAYNNSVSVIHYCLIVFSFLPGIAFGEMTDWVGKVIDLDGYPAPEYVEDYPTNRLGAPWNFATKGNGYPTHWQGISAPQLSNGNLRFHVSKKATITWGDFDLTGTAYELDIGVDWGEQRWPWVIEIDARQSVNNARWKLEAAFDRGGRVRTYSSESMGAWSGTKTLRFDMGAAGRDAYHALRLSIDGQAGDVEIYEIRIVRPSIQKVFMTDIQLGEKPEFAELQFASSGKTSIYVNGSKMGDFGAMHPFSRRINRLEFPRYIREGVNSICVEVETYNSVSRADRPGRQFFFMDGMVVDRTGEIQRFGTDRKWRGAFGSDGCSDAEVWRAGRGVKVLGSVRSNWFAMNGYGKNDKASYPYYRGRFQLSYGGKSDYPFIMESEDVRVGVQVHGSVNEESTLRYTLRHWSDKLGSIGEPVVKGEIPLSSGVMILGAVPPGAYELHVALYDGDIEIDSYIGELIIIGEMRSAKTAGLSLLDGLIVSKVDEKEFKSSGFDGVCGQAGGRTNPDYQQNRFSFDPGGQSINPGGALMLPRGRLSWCSLNLKNGDLSYPHLIEIRYQADKHHNLAFVLSEDSEFGNLHNLRSREGIVRLSSGVHSTGTDGDIGVARYLYWPSRDHSNLTVVNALTDNSQVSGIYSVRMYEVTNGLPEWDMPNNDLGLLIGPFVERVDRTTPRLFYSGDLEAKFSRDQLDGYYPGYYAAWYKTISRLVGYMKFSGQNTYFAGAYMYYGGWFPSARFQGNPTSGVNDLPVGWKGGPLDLLAMMFEKNDLNLVLGVQFIGSKQLRDIDRISDKKVQDGASTTRFVTDAGSQVSGFQGHGYDFMQAHVQKEMLTLIDELAEAYAHYPAFKGVTWARLPEYPAAPGIDGDNSPLNTGYGDLTIETYRAETGSSIPVWDGEHDRFAKRKEWLLDNEYENWLDWRAKKAWELIAALHDKLVSHRMDLDFWHVVHRPDPSMVRQWSNGGMTMRDIYRTMGVDPSRYMTTGRGPRLMVVNDIGAGHKYSRRGNLREISDAVAQLYRSQEFIDLFAGHGMFSHIGFMLEAGLSVEGDWAWNDLRVVGYSLPTNESVIPYDCTDVEGKTLTAIAIGWSDVGHLVGYEQDVRDYLRRCNARH